MAALACGTAWGQAPSYSAAGIVNASDYSPGPFAPNSVLSLFGTNLAYTFATASQGNISGDTMPTHLAGITVLVDGSPAPLLAVLDCETYQQINFLVPSTQIPGDVTVQEVRQSIVGPPVTITLAAAAPALFPDPNHANYVIAQDGDATGHYAAITPDAPAYPGEMVVLYATGLGHTNPNYDPGEIPTTAAYIDNWTTAFQVLVNGVAIDSSRVTYAGLTPFCVGLYQVNFYLPGSVAPDPEIRVSVAGRISISGLKLAVEASPGSAAVLIHETSLAGDTLNR